MSTKAANPSSPDRNYPPEKYINVEELIEPLLKQILDTSTPLHTSTPLQFSELSKIKPSRTSSAVKSRSNFWERGDRVIALGSGGAFLGALIAQLPGAVIGGVIATLFAWFTYSSKVHPKTESVLDEQQG